MTDFCGNSVGTHFCSCKNDACAAPVRRLHCVRLSERARNGARSIELHSVRFVLCCYIHTYTLNESNAERIARALFPRGAGNLLFMRNTVAECTRSRIVSAEHEIAWLCLFKDVPGSMGET